MATRRRTPPPIPHARLGAPDVARMLEIKIDTWWAYVTRGTAPRPDGREESSGRPWWYQSTIASWVKRRRRGARVRAL